MVHSGVNASWPVAQLAEEARTASSHTADVKRRRRGSECQAMCQEPERLRVREQVRAAAFGVGSFLDESAQRLRWQNHRQGDVAREALKIAK